MRQFTADLAERGTRVKGFLAMTLIGVGPIALYQLGLIGFISGDIEVLNAYLGLYPAVLVLYVVVGIVNLILMLAVSTNIGARIVGVEYVDAITGERSGGKVFLKYLLIGAVASASVGIAYLTLFTTYRDGQHWVDRAVGLVGVQRDSVGAPEPDREAPETEPEPTVKQVSLEPSRTDFDGSREAEDASKSDEIASTPFAASTSASATSEPRRPARSEPGEIITSSPFAPAGQKPIPSTPSPATPAEASPISAPAEPAQSAVPMLDDASLLGSDETVLDADAANAAPSLVVDDGTVITLDTPVVIGRNPSAPDSHPGSELVRLVDESMRLSKNHALLEFDQGDVLVTDLGARNGVFLDQDGNKARIPSQTPTRVPRGAKLHVGGRTITR